MQYSREALTKRFWELEQAKKELEEALAPLKKERDALMAKIGPDMEKAREIGREIKAKEAKAGLVEIDQERAFISRGLGGKVA